MNCYKFSSVAEFSENLIDTIIYQIAAQVNQSGWIEIVR